MMLGERLRCMLCICRYEIVYTMTMPLPNNLATSQAFQSIVGKLRREACSIVTISCLVYVQ